MTATLAGRPVLHRLVDAAVAVCQLVRAETERPAEHLVAETDAEERHPGVQHSPCRSHRVIGGRRVTGAVGEEDSVGAGREQLLGGRCSGVDGDLDTAGGHPGRGAPFDAEVERGDAITHRTVRRDDVGLGGRDRGCEVGTEHLFTR